MIVVGRMLCVTEIGRRRDLAVTCPHGLLYAWVTGTSALQIQLASRLVSILFLTNKQNKLKPTHQIKKKSRMSLLVFRHVPSLVLLSAAPGYSPPWFLREDHPLPGVPGAPCGSLGPGTSSSSLTPSHPHQQSQEPSTTGSGLHPGQLPLLPSLDTHPQEVGQPSPSQALGHRGHPLSRQCGLPKYYQEPSSLQMQKV